MNKSKLATDIFASPTRQATSANDGVLDAIDLYLELEARRPPLHEATDDARPARDDMPEPDGCRFAWRDTLHFAPRRQGQSTAQAIARHRHWLAHKLQLDGRGRVLDVGCGDGDAMHEIHRLVGCRIVGIDSRPERVRQAAAMIERAGLASHCSAARADLAAMPLPDACIDAAYAIESTVHAPRRAAACAEVRRVLRPNGLFGSYEWCMTSRFDPYNAAHRAIKRQIEIGCGVPPIAGTGDVVCALRQAGFRVLETDDRGGQGDVPWWEPLSPSWHSPMSLRDSHLGARTMIAALRWAESLGIVAPGTASAATMRAIGGRALVAGGRLGIFTPAFFVLAKKRLE